MAVTANKLGRYELRREIARSNDVVYEAVDPALNRRVAVKEMTAPPGLSASAARDRLARFHREARAAGALTHPNIVTIYEVGEDLGRHFIAMEFLEGPTLREALEGGQVFDPDRAANIAAQVADALAYAHKHGVIHRDVKPDNVHLVTPTHPKLTDFGIARVATEANITVAGQVFGTPSYMSPEQIAGGDIDARTDIFSLGVMLYEMLTGRKPFTGDSVVTITYNIVHEMPAIPPSVPPHLAAILRKAMAKQPEDRYASAAEMAEDLRQGRAPAGFAVPPSAPQPTAWAASASAWQPVLAPTAMPAPPAPAAPARDGVRTFAIAMLITLVLVSAGVWTVYLGREVLQREKAILAAHQLDALRRTSSVNPSAPGDSLPAPTLSQPVPSAAPAPAVQRPVEVPRGQTVGAALAARARANFETGRRLIGEGRLQEAVAYLNAALDDVNDQRTLPDATLRGNLAQAYIDLARQAGSSGSIGLLTARDLLNKAEAADPVGPIGSEAMRMMSGE